MDADPPERDSCSVIRCDLEQWLEPCCCTHGDFLDRYDQYAGMGKWAIPTLAVEIEESRGAQM
ncbi:hypothetical protein MLP_16720 [Microlunatus phosphovorus NM-1]|uniref:Uncharacterized protein n=1 Tax=Microlunatus phosphovorus (strain ATCC 700054 / DSM 10555 / JCM 9379 / NBRC 101784 / NCIMB 13414 / VKM Ac-1990 / NM-1) TaxID=1032480 RepID=F5XRJ6_MICPN|nr:hypothetical protein MLP_16720 [Microlunatus phosphovorus NM-1]